MAELLWKNNKNDHTTTQFFFQILTLRAKNNKSAYATTATFSRFNIISVNLIKEKYSVDKKVSVVSI